METVEEYLRRHAVLDGKGNMDGEFVPISIAHIACQQCVSGKLELQEMTHIAVSCDLCNGDGRALEGMHGQGWPYDECPKCLGTKWMPPTTGRLRQIYQMCQADAGCGPWSDQLQRKMRDHEHAYVLMQLKFHPDGSSSFASIFFGLMNPTDAKNINFMERYGRSGTMTRRTSSEKPNHANTGKPSLGQQLRNADAERESSIGGGDVDGEAE